MSDRETATTACPTCGLVAERTIYDVGDGPELSCAACEWCWGAEGQSLSRITPSAAALWLLAQRDG